MVLEKFTKLKFTDPLLSRFQLGLEKFFNQFSDNPIIKGVLLEDVSIETTTTEINHGLGRTPVGFIVVDLDTAAMITRTESDTNKITLQASAACTVKLWVF